MEGLTRDLTPLGFSEKEAAVYVASLSLGPATVRELAQMSHVNRATTYLMVESLLHRGLMSTITQGAKRLYVPETPERLKEWMRLEKEKIAKKEEQLAGALPMLFALFNGMEQKPTVRYLEGADGLKTVREMFLKEPGEFVQIVPFDLTSSRPELREGREAYWSALAAQAVPHRAILVTADPQKSIERLPGGTIRFLPSDRFPLTAEISVRGQTVFLYAFKPAILSILITSQELADAMRALFELSWAGTATAAK